MLDFVPSHHVPPLHFNIFIKPKNYGNINETFNNRRNYTYNSSLLPDLTEPALCAS